MVSRLSSFKLFRFELTYVNQMSRDNEGGATLRDGFLCSLTRTCAAELVSSAEAVCANCPPPSLCVPAALPVQLGRCVTVAAGRVLFCWRKEASLSFSFHSLSLSLSLSLSRARCRSREKRSTSPAPPASLRGAERRSASTGPCKSARSYRGHSRIRTCTVP